MRRLAWLTDLHLNFVPPKTASAFLESVNELPVDAVLFGGDISESSRLLLDLSEMCARIRKPMYFVLGNHDYYKSSISVVRRNVSQLCQRMPNLIWLSETGVVELSPTTALVGHDGWGDGTLGSMEDAVGLNDDRLIEELTTFDRHTLFARLRELGEEAATHTRRVLTEAAGKYPNICLLTHVPPFKESCWHDGSFSDDAFLPRFACGQMGEAIQDVMAEHPQSQLTVLCGHTHSNGHAQILSNLHVWTGGVDYGMPKIQRLFQVP